jgi:hypothetical protein
MTPRSVRRAVERNERRDADKAEHGSAIESPQAAASPLPIPDEPEPAPMLPVPVTIPPDEDTEKDVPPPATSRSQELLVAGESVQEFEEFSERLFNHYMPYDQEEQVLVGKLVESRWFLRRRKEAFEKLEADLYAAEPNPAQWSEADFQRLALADNYRNEAELVAGRAQRRVQAFTRERVEDQRFHIKQNLALSQLELAKKKYQLQLWKAGLLPVKKNASEEAEPATKTAAAR